MAKDKQYTGKDIAALTDREHVRLRTQIYFGNMHPTTFLIPVLNKTTTGFKLKEIEFIPAAYKAINEIIDNSLDEFNHLSSKIKLLKIEADPKNGRYTIIDNGRGIPIDKHAIGKYTPEVALSQLRSGRNFTDEKEIGVIGQNGVGAACTNFCSSEFFVTIYRDGYRYQQKFLNGAAEIFPPKLTPVNTTTRTGTEISFQLDKAVFKNIELPTQLILNRVIEIAMTNPDITVEYNGERYRFKKGMEEVVQNLSDHYFKFELNESHIQGEFYILFNVYKGIDEQMFTWVNSSLLFDGGKCNTQFFNAFFDRVITHLQPTARKNKTEVTRNDIRENLLVLASIKLKNPEYDSQSKTRLTGPDLRKELTTMIDKQWRLFVKKNETWLQTVMERASQRHHYESNKKAILEHEKQKKKRVDGLLDATSRIRSECQLLITEGMCLDEHTPIKILSSEGLVDVPLKNVNIGDTVITHKNNLKPITNITRTLKRGTRIITSIGQVVCSDQHRWLAYDTTTHRFDWVPTNALNANVHKLVRNRLGDWVYCAEFVIENNKDADNVVYPRVIITAFETIKTSLTHTFIVLDIDTYAIMEIPFSELDPSRHLMLLFKSKK